MHGFQEMEVFDDRSIEENEANFFAAELLLEDEEVLECLSEHTFFETAKMLYVPAALLDYKFSLLHEKGELVNSMYIRKADFLKGDLHAYDNDIDYGDIWISVFYFLTKKSTSTMHSASWLVDFLVIIRNLFGSSKNIMSANKQKHKALSLRVLTVHQSESRCYIAGFAQWDLSWTWAL